MSTLKLKFIKAPDAVNGPKRRTETVIEVPLRQDLTLDQMRQLLEAEIALNSFPVNLRVHFTIEG